MTAPTATIGYWRAIRRVHRLEYPFLIVYPCHGLWGAAYAVASARHLLDAPVLIAVLATMIPPISQNVLNAGQDIRSDSLNPGKSGIAVAARRIGVTALTWWCCVEMGVAVLLAGLVSMWVGRPLVVIAMAVAVVLHLAYNLEPVRLKRRGFFNPFYFMMTFGFLPCLTSYVAAAAGLPGSLWLLCLGFGLLMAGRTLWWAVPDRDADVATGATTPVVRLGASRAWLAACLLTATGIAVLGWGVWLRLGPFWALVVVAATGLFLVDKVRNLARVSDDRLPSERRMRTHSLTVVAVTDTLVWLVPLIASRL